MNANFDEVNSESITNDLNGQVDFINKLEHDYTKFIEDWTYEYKKYYELFKNNINNRPNIIRLRKSILNIEKICKHNYKDNKNTSLIHVNIVPEKIVTKSPLTILNGQWGSGKTHFLTELLISIKKEKIKPKIIKKYIYIDSWKYLSSNNLVNDFIVELGKNLALDSGIKWFNSKKMIRNIFNYAVVPNINKRFGLAIPKLNDENSILTINRNITSPTLIIIDNIERLGPIAWEVIRVIQKLSISTNLIFLLSINKDKFNELCGLSTNGYEWNLEKYISIPFYNLKPNYEDLIDSYNIPKKYNKVINTILTTPSSKGFLSVREAEKILKLCGFNKNKNINIPNKYFLLSIFKKVWDPSTKEKINGSDAYESVIFKIVSKDLIDFYRDYIFKLIEINNEYYDHINSSNFQMFNIYHPTFNDAKFRFFSFEFEKYINKLVNSMTILKKSNFNLLDIDNDVHKIKQILSSINSDPDIVEINNASKIIYKKYFDSYYYLSTKDVDYYNKNYCTDTIKYLLNL